MHSGQPHGGGGGDGQSFPREAAAWCQPWGRENSARARSARAVTGWDPWSHGVGGQQAVGDGLRTERRDRKVLRERGAPSKSPAPCPPRVLKDHLWQVRPWAGTWDGASPGGKASVGSASEGTLWGKGCSGPATALCLACRKLVAQRAGVFLGQAGRERAPAQGRALRAGERLGGPCLPAGGTPQLRACPQLLPHSSLRSTSDCPSGGRCGRDIRRGRGWLRGTSWGSPHLAQAT